MASDRSDGMESGLWIICPRPAVSYPPNVSGLSAITNPMNRHRRFPALAAALIGIAAPVGRADAAFTVVAPTGTTPGILQITEDIHFLIAAAGDVQLFVLDEWVASDGSQSVSIISPGLSITLNGTGIAVPSNGTFVDNLTLTAGAFTGNDGYLYNDSPVSVVAGDILTLKAATYLLGPESSFNSLATQTFAGNIFLTDVSANLVPSSITTVPEPASALLLGLAGIGLPAMRMRRK